MRILHLSADYPDPVHPAKTLAIRNLLELVPQHIHHVFSLNRTHWHGELSMHRFDDRVATGNTAIQYLYSFPS